MKQPRRDLKGDPSGLGRAIQYGGDEYQDKAQAAIAKAKGE